MSACALRHARAGIVTTHPNGYVRGEPSAALVVCGRPNCIIAAKRWVRINSGGLAGIYLQDPPEARREVA